MTGAPIPPFGPFNDSTAPSADDRHRVGLTKLLRPTVQGPGQRRQTVTVQSHIGRTAVFGVIAFLGFAPPLFAQLAVNGRALTVTTANATATFAGSDLVGLANTLTGETYLKKASAGELANVNTIVGTGQGLQASNWSIGPEPGTGDPIATITLSDSSRSLTMAVKVDAASQEIVVRMNAANATPGVRDASWSIAGLDFAAGRLIVPAQSGAVFDQAHVGVGSSMQYPSDWHAQMAVYETAAGSVVFYSTDQQFLFKDLRITTRGSSTIDVALATEAVGPWTAATAVPQVEWRLKAFVGNWRTAAQVYKNWLMVNRPPLSNAQHPWTSNIRAVVGVHVNDASLLTPLALKLVPAQTLLYLVDWRQASYDINYPDYTPRAGVAGFIASAHALGFKVMLHTDYIGVSPGNSDYTPMQPYQVRSPESLDLVGWQWNQSTPTRFAYINPAASAYRSLWISRVAAAVSALSPDALHLDISAPMNNDGNGLIGGMTFPQGSNQFHQDIAAAFPGLALGGEGENDILYRYESFAQAWYGRLQGHPIATFLFGPQVQYYGHLSQNGAAQPGFKRDLAELGRRGILPRLVLSTSSDLDTSVPANARLFAIMQSWQSHAFHLSAAPDWEDALVKYDGLSGSTATLTDSGSLLTLTAAGTQLLQLAHDAVQVATTSFIPGWPAFDGAAVFGLNPSGLAYLDPIPRPDATHATALPSGVTLAPGSIVGDKFAHLELAAVPSRAFDAIGSLVNAVTGVRYQGQDVPLGNGALVQVSTIIAGGEQRSGLFIHPPFLGQLGGETFVEYAVAVPVKSLLRFSVGVADNASCTDGVTFRVTVAGTEVWTEHVERTGWHDVSLNIAPFAGTKVPVRLASNPGPASNPNCDWSLWSGVSIVADVAAVTANVPIVLGSGSIYSGFDGDGTFALTPAFTAAVSNLPVPGSFTIFTQPGTNVGAVGISLTSLPFDVWSGAHADVAQPGAVLGSGSVGPIMSGGVISLAISAHPPHAGRTVLSWSLHLPAGEPRGLSWSAGLQDGAYSDDGVDFDVLVNGISYWHRTTAVNQWIPGSITLAAWQGQNVLLELVTSARANYIFDWAAWGDLILSSSSVSCGYTLPGASTVDPTGGSFTMAVTATTGCPWKAVSSAPWLIATTGSGSGSGTVQYSVAPNLGPPRTATITAGGQTFTVSQGAANLVRNGAFTSGQFGWQTYATPDPSYIVWGVSDGVLQFDRVPAATPNQAVVFQETGMMADTGQAITATFELGNSGSVRRRLSVLVLEHNFSDLSVCTFWIPPNSPLRTYEMRTHSTRAWSNAAVYFYAATAGNDGGFYLLDNVSLAFAGPQSSPRTDCVDANAPPAPGGTDGADLIDNGNFSNGLAPWGPFGQIVSQLQAGVFEFYRLQGTPAGVVLQRTGQPMAANQIIRSTFQLGNSSAVRKRVTVLMHDADFTDLSACTFYLSPGLPLSDYTMRAFATKPWSDATLSIYPATVGTEAWIRLDNATLRRAPSTTLTGTECVEPAGP